MRPTGADLACARIRRIDDTRAHAACAEGRVDHARLLRSETRAERTARRRDGRDARHRPDDGGEEMRRAARRVADDIKPVGDHERGRAEPVTGTPRWVKLCEVRGGRLVQIGVARPPPGMPRAQVTREGDRLLGTRTRLPGRNGLPERTVGVECLGVPPLVVLIRPRGNAGDDAHVALPSPRTCARFEKPQSAVDAACLVAMHPARDEDRVPIAAPGARAHGEEWVAHGIVRQGAILLHREGGGRERVQSGAHVGAVASPTFPARAPACALGCAPRAAGRADGVGHRYRLFSRCAAAPTQRGG